MSTSPFSTRHSDPSRQHSAAPWSSHSQEDFAAFRLAPESDVIRLTDDVLQAVGLTPHPIEYLGGSDANMLNAKGIPAVNLGIGAQNPHGDDEFILIEDLHKTEEIALRDHQTHIGPPMRTLRPSIPDTGRSHHRAWRLALGASHATPKGTS